MIAIDWGSSSLRAFRLDAAGAIRDTRRSEQGAMKCDGRFAEVLAGIVEGWDDRLVVMAGMIGSRQGWIDAGYVACPAGPADIAAQMQRLPQDAFPSREVWLVPGLSTVDAHQVPDVMRGEETQLCGVLPELGEGTHHVCLPGTHSKHVRVVDGRIDGFATHMTGEVFELLCRHSVLARTMEDGPHDAAAFADGVAMAARSRDLLHPLFTLRSRALFDQLAPSQGASYLSGVLVGHELQALPDGVSHLHFISAENLAAPYLQAIQLRGGQATHHNEDAAARGLHRLAVLRGLMETT